ncbi:MAG: hypothetical protein IJ808_00695 [Muribaculaceae bacterium]|nr:hypothetical protein [Muribaculaceae bacterium]
MFFLPFAPHKRFLPPNIRFIPANAAATTNKCKSHACFAKFLLTKVAMLILIKIYFLILLTQTFIDRKNGKKVKLFNLALTFG